MTHDKLHREGLSMRVLHDLKSTLMRYYNNQQCYNIQRSGNARL